MNDIVFRRDFKRAGGTVEVAPREIADRYRVSARDLALSEAASESLPKSLQRLQAADSKCDFQTWREHQWAAAIQYFVASLDGDYADLGDNYREVHDEVLSRYAATNEMPVSLDPVGDPIELAVPAPVSVPITQTLLQRRTTLVPSMEPLSLDELAAILYRAMARIRAFRTSAIESRPELAMTNFAPALSDTQVLELLGLPTDMSMQAVYSVFFLGSVTQWE